MFLSLPWEGKTVVGGLAWEGHMCISPNSVGTFSQSLWKCKEKLWNCVLFLSGQGAEGTFSKAQVVSGERKKSEPIYRIHGKKNTGFWWQKYPRVSLTEDTLGTTALTTHDKQTPLPKCQERRELIIIQYLLVHFRDIFKSQSQNVVLDYLDLNSASAIH